MNLRENLHLLTLAGLLALAAAAAVPGVAAQGDALTLDVEAHDGDGAFWFTVSGSEGRNPPLLIAPGTNVTVNFANAGTMPHNFHAGDPIQEATEILDPEGTETLVFTVPDPAPATIDYWCDPHISSKMKGAIATTQAAYDDLVAQENAGDNESPGLTFGAVAAALGVVAAVTAARGRR